MAWYGSIAHAVAGISTLVQPEARFACQMRVLCSHSYNRSRLVRELNTVILIARAAADCTML
jgi:hypothetical protein